MLKNGEKISVLLTIFVIITIIAMGMFLIFKDDLFVFRNNKPIYTRNEPVLAELKFGSTKGELMKKLGNPKKVKKQWWVLMVIM
jgi:cell division protein YceG involved in septum cleavage